jgi:uncharacterized lipoprotein YmbA
MKPKFYRLVAVAILLTLAGCASMDREYYSLKEWRRSYMPTRQG